MTTVTWVTGRQKALARAIALELAAARGLRWQALSQAERDNQVHAAELVVQGWVHRKVLATYENEYLELPEGGEPLVVWPSEATAGICPVCKAVAPRRKDGHVPRHRRTGGTWCEGGGPVRKRKDGSEIGGQRVSRG